MNIDSNVIDQLLATLLMNIYLFSMKSMHNNHSIIIIDNINVEYKCISNRLIIDDINNAYQL